MEVFGITFLSCVMFVSKFIHYYHQLFIRFHCPCKYCYEMPQHGLFLSDIELKISIKESFVKIVAIKLYLNMTRLHSMQIE